MPPPTAQFTPRQPSPDGSASQASREELFRRLFDEYYRPIFYFFARRGFAREECRDLTQETFTNAVKGVGELRSETSYESWLFRIAKHLWLNEMRDRAAQKRRRREVSFDETSEDGEPLPARGALAVDCANPGPEELLLRDERVTLVRTALEQLPPRMRHCLILRLEGLKYREIAAVLRVSLQTVRSQLSQARERLRELLGEYFQVEELPGPEEEP